MEEKIQKFLNNNPSFAKKFQSMTMEEKVLAVKILKAII